MHLMNKTLNADFIRQATTSQSISDPLVQKNFTVLSTKLVLAYAEDILSDPRLKNRAEFNPE